MKFGKRCLAWLLLAAFLLSAGCSGPADGNEPAPGAPSGRAQDGGGESALPEQGSAGQSSSGATPEHDTDVGLKNIKIDSTGTSLTDEQRLMLNYFDSDYFDYPSYEFLRRYPQIFDGAQIYVWGTVKKIISLDSDTVQMVLGLYMSDDWYTEAGENDYLLLTGPVGRISYLEGDYLEVYGRCDGLETIDLDGVSHTVPKVNMHAAYINGGKTVDAATVKKLATALFGGDFEIKKPVIDVDITGEDNILMYFPGSFDGYTDPNCLMVELDDQSSTKLSKFLFGIYDGWIRPYKDGSNDYIVERSLEFAPDFSHFFLFTLDKDLESLTLEYYDQGLERIWKREFSGVTAACYDYTASNIYFAVNNELYIINTQTGEDTFPPAYVGEKTALRKLSDGILMVAESQADAIMKCGLDGSILWKASLDSKVSYHMPSMIEESVSVQLIGGNIVLKLILEHDYETHGTYSGEHYIVVNPDTGEIIQDAEELR